jgi:hypothetical protein
VALTVDIIKRLCEDDRTLFCDYLQLCEFLNFALVVCDMRLMTLWVYIAHQSVVPKFFGLSVLLCRQGTPRKRKGPLKGTKGWDRFRTEEAFYTNPNPECLCFQSQHVEKTSEIVEGRSTKFIPPPPPPPQSWTDGASSQTNQSIITGHQSLMQRQ